MRTDWSIASARRGARAAALWLINSVREWIDAVAAGPPPAVDRLPALPAPEKATTKVGSKLAGKRCGSVDVKDETGKVRSSGK